jgi:hypothetical protein
LDLPGFSAGWEAVGKDVLNDREFVMAFVAGKFESSGAGVGSERVDSESFQLADHAVSEARAPTVEDFAGGGGGRASVAESYLAMRGADAGLSQVDARGAA